MRTPRQDESVLWSPTKSMACHIEDYGYENTDVRNYRMRKYIADLCFDSSVVSEPDTMVSLLMLRITENNVNCIYLPLTR